MYLEALTNLATYAEANQAAARQLWEAMAMAQCKYHNYAAKVNLIGLQKRSTPEEKAAEDRLATALDLGDGLPVRAVLEWALGTEAGEKMAKDLCA